MKYEMIDCVEGDSRRRIDEIDDRGMRSFECKKCDINKKIKSDYLIIDDPVEAVLFVGKRATFHCSDYSPFDGIVLEWDTLRYFCSYSNAYITVHKSNVKETCEAVEGYPVLRFKDTGFIFHEPVYDGIMTEYTGYIKANALTIGKSVAELKELIKWYKE